MGEAKGSPQVLPQASLKQVIAGPHCSRQATLLEEPLKGFGNGKSAGRFQRLAGHDAAPFEVYIETQLAPTLSTGDVVVLDNVAFHKSQRAEDLIRARGAWTLFLPPYSPDLNPIELAFSKLTTLLRKRAARSFDAVCEAKAACGDENGTSREEVGIFAQTAMAPWRWRHGARRCLYRQRLRQA